jgi:uncharacterized repeat protein (TIGR02543 family)
MKKTVVFGFLAIMLVFGFIGCDSGNEETTYTVTFNSNGGSTVEAISGIASGSRITLPTPPTKAGNNFVGWYIDNNTFLNEFTAETPIIQNITVFAKWNSKVVDAKYRFSGGEWRTAPPFTSGSAVPGVISVLDENSYTVSGGGVSISLANVYTDGGGTLKEGSDDVFWAYLYNSFGKIGVVITIPDMFIDAHIGKTFVDTHMVSATGINIVVDSSGMQNSYNGVASGK